MKISPRLNANGFSHVIVMAAFVLVVAVGGTFYEVASHADACPVVASGRSTTDKITKSCVASPTPVKAPIPEPTTALGLSRIKGLTSFGIVGNSTGTATANACVGAIGTVYYANGNTSPVSGVNSITMVGYAADKSNQRWSVTVTSGTTASEIVSLANTKYIAFFDNHTESTVMPISSIDSCTTTVKPVSSTTTPVSINPNPPVSTPPAAPTTLAAYKQAGDTRIAERLVSLKVAIATVTNNPDLKASSKAVLLNQMNSELTGLQSLQTTLDADTSATAARVDYQNIVVNYRVYLLILPKASLIQYSDNEQTTQANLSVIATKLAIAIAQQKAAAATNKMQGELKALQINIKDGNTISTTVENEVINLVPSDYDTNPLVMEGDYHQLNLAHADDVEAATLAQAIVTALN